MRITFGPRSRQRCAAFWPQERSSGPGSKRHGERIDGAHDLADKSVHRSDAALGSGSVGKFGSRGIRLRCFQRRRASLLSQPHSVAPRISARPDHLRTDLLDRRDQASPRLRASSPALGLNRNDETGGKVGFNARLGAAPPGQPAGPKPIACAARFSSPRN